MDEAGTRLVVHVACVAARADATHRSEMVTQWLCGEPLSRLETAGEWVRCRGSDGYVAWCSTGSLLQAPANGAWEKDATLRSLGCSVRVEVGGSGEAAGRHLWLPFGARAAPLPDGGLRLPDGRVARAERPDAVVDSKERSSRFPATPARVVRSARRWLGAPYLWGGRTEKGTDCSGLVQAVFDLHGVALPRDSGPQSRMGVRVEQPRTLDFQAGDLLFFGENDERITHVALATGGPSILHAADANGAVAEDDLSADTTLCRRLRERLQAVRRPLSGSAEESALNPPPVSSPPGSRSPRRGRRHG